MERVFLHRRRLFCAAARRRARFFCVAVFVVVTLGILLCVEYRALQEDGWRGVGQAVE